MKKFNDTVSMYEAYAKNENIGIVSALSLVKDVSAAYFESVTGIKAHKPVMFYIQNFGYVSD